MNRTAITLIFAGAVLAGCAQPARISTAAANGPASAEAPSPVPPTMQYLYGSAEAAAASEQAYNALVDAVIARLKRERERTPAAGDRFSAVLVPGSTLDNPTMVPCGDKPRAVVFDIDETILLNLGYEADEAAHPAGLTMRRAGWRGSGRAPTPWSPRPARSTPSSCSARPA